MNQSRALFASPYAAQASDGQRVTELKAHDQLPEGWHWKQDICGEGEGPAVAAPLFFHISCLVTLNPDLYVLSPEFQFPKVFLEHHIPNQIPRSGLGPRSCL